MLPEKKKHLKIDGQPGKNTKKFSCEIDFTKFLWKWTANLKNKNKTKNNSVVYEDDDKLITILCV